MQVTLAQQLSQLTAGSWNALSGAESVYLSYNWLRFVEQDTHAEHSYLVASSHEDMVLGALPLYAVQDEHNANYDTSRVLNGRLSGDFLLAGTRHGYTNDVLLHPTLGPDEGDRVLETMLAAAEHRASDLARDDVLFLYLTTAAARRLVRVRPALRPYLLGPDTTLNVTGSGFGDYLGHLPKKQAGNVRREMRRFRDCGYRVGIERLSDCWQEAGPLVSNVQQRYGHPESPESCSEALRVQAEFLDQSAKVFTARRDGQLMAFSLHYSWRGSLFSRLVGFDYANTTDMYEYFNLNFYEPLIFAFENSHHCVHLGRGSYQGKLQRGARPRARWAVALNRGDTDTEWREWNSAHADQWRAELNVGDIEVPAEWL